MNQAKLSFRTTPVLVNEWWIVRLPKQSSQQLRSRGQVCVLLKVGSDERVVVLEPDGEFGHWFRLTDEMVDNCGVDESTELTIHLKECSDWPEPDIPTDVLKRLMSQPSTIQKKWGNITPMARWEWIRWINSTSNESTRAGRIDKTFSKLAGRHTRPCCFNLAACTQPHVAKNGKLIS